MTLKDFLIRYAHRIGKRDIKALEQMKSDIQIKNWMKVQRLKLGLQEEQIELEFEQVESECDSLLNEIIETVKNKRVFAKMIQDTYEAFQDWSLVIAELRLYSDSIESMGLKEHVNEEYLRVKKSINN